MIAKLFSKTGALAGTEFFIETEALIGRDTHCDITLYPHTISSQHARIFLDQEKGVFFLEDMGSSNGTFVDKTRVSSPMGLGKLHVITFANDVDMIFQLLPEAGIDRPTLSDKPASSAPAQEKKDGQHTEFQQAFVMPTGVLPGVEKDDPGNKTTYGQSFDMLPEIPPEVPAEILHKSEEPDIREYTLIINTMKESGKRVRLIPGENVIGRSEGCEVSINDEYLSGRHAMLRVEARGVFLKDLESRNGTFIGDEAVKEEQLLVKGVIFRLGPTTKIMIE